MLLNFGIGQSAPSIGRLSKPAFVSNSSDTFWKCRYRVCKSQPRDNNSNFIVSSLPLSIVWFTSPCSSGNGTILQLPFVILIEFQCTVGRKEHNENDIDFIIISILKLVGNLRRFSLNKPPRCKSIQSANVTRDRYIYFQQQWIDEDVLKSRTRWTHHICEYLSPDARIYQVKKEIETFTRETTFNQTALGRRSVHL
jgi:hypothetical protein